MNFRLELQFFVWKFVRDMLPIRDKLKSLGMSINGDISIYFTAEDDIDYIFKSCDLAITFGVLLKIIVPTC